jgi:photosystem II stability/assembly factor-like uncharacterized protein
MSRIWLSLLLITFSISAATEGFAQGGRFQQQQTRTSAARDVPKTELPKSWAEQIDFRSVGPTNMGGRIVSIAVYEKDSSIWWAASASGGLLKTDNNGVTFEHQFTDQATVSIGDVQVAQSDPNILWVGTGEANPRNSVSWGDGVYKSTDGGKTWKNMGLKKSFQIGRIAIHPTNPDIVYVGALGRLWGPNEERGLFKTTDGGDNWEKIHFVDDKTGVIDVKMNPKNPNELIIATYERQRDGFDGNDPGKKYGEGSGIYKTTDGGKTFTKLTEGLPTNKMGRIGLDYFRKDPKFVYAIIECEKIAQIPPNYAYAGLNSENIEGGIGAKITTVTERGPSEKAGLKENDIVIQINGKIIHNSDDLLSQIRRGEAGDKLKLTVAREEKTVDIELELGKNPATQRGGGGGGGGGRGGRGGGGGNPFTGTLGGQAANLQDQQTSEGYQYGGIYMSKNGGESWTRINSLNPRPMYYSQFRVDPVDRNFMYTCGTSLYKSSDGGKTFTGDGGSDGIHVDHHALWIDPQNPKHMILGNDGGLHVTYDRMTHWQHHNNFAICQFYHISVSSRPDYHIYGGLQDNGSWGGPSVVRNANGSSNNDWYRVGGGDGFVTISDPNDPDLIYFESQNGGMGRINLRTGDRGSIRPGRPQGGGQGGGQGGQRYRFNWKTPFILSPHNSQIHYSAGNHVFRSIKKGDSLQAISPDITNTNDGAGSAISESPMTEGVLYVGTTDGAIWMTRDGGAQWQPIFSTKEERSNERSRRRSEDDGDQSSDAPLGIEISAALTQDDSEIDGHWDGEFISEQIQSGRASFTLELKSAQDGSVRGGYQSRRGQGDITTGNYNSETGEIKFTIADERVSMIFSGKVTDGKMSGEININDGQMKVDFVAMRKPAEKDQAADSKEADKKQAEKEANAKAEAAAAEKVAQQKKEAAELNAPKQAEQKSEQAEETKQQQEEDKPNQSPVQDPISGTWQGKLIAEQLPEGSSITLKLKMDSEGKVTGTSETNQGDNEVSGKYDAETKKLTLSAENERFTLDFTATVGAETMEGWIDINGDAFSIDFEAKRTEKPEPSVQQEQPESDERPRAQRPRRSQQQEGESQQRRERQGDEGNEGEQSQEEEEDSTGSKPLAELVPGPRWVSALEASRYRPGRVYLSLDGHRSDDDEVYVFASENYGRTWRSIRANLPTSAGSVRVIREDHENANLLYLGCEFSSWVSIDRGKSWTELTGMPTVSVHEYAQHEESGDLVVGTHGRGVWIGNSTLLRQVTPEVLDADAHLFKPAKLTRWRREAGRGDHGTHAFVGRNPSSSVTIYYSLGSDADEVKLVIKDLEGNTIYDYDELETNEGLHSVEFDGRRQSRRQAGGRFQGRRFGGPPLDAGTYLVTLSVGGNDFKQTVEIVNDPAQPEAAATQQWQEYLDELFATESEEDESGEENDR